MDVQAAKEFLERRSVDDLQSIIVLAQQQIQRIKENQQAKYMGAIRKAFEDYFENVGPIEVTFGYEDADGMEGAATVEVDSSNPPCFCQQSIEFPGEKWLDLSRFFVQFDEVSFNFGGALWATTRRVCTRVLLHKFFVAFLCKLPA